MYKKCKILFLFASMLFLTVLPVFALEGTVVSVLGKVELQSGNSWVSLKTGDIVQSGLVISTGFRSQAIIQVAGSTITVKQLTRLTLEQLTENDSSHNSKVYLDLGSIKADVKQAENKRVGFTVNTPVATASVRGTGYEMGIRDIAVYDGTVSFMLRTNTDDSDSLDDSEGEDNGGTLVRAGNSSSISKGQNRPSSPQSNLIRNSIAVNSVMPTDQVSPIIESPATSSLSAATGTSASSGGEASANVTVTVSFDN